MGRHSEASGNSGERGAEQQRPSEHVEIPNIMNERQIQAFDAYHDTFALVANPRDFSERSQHPDDPNRGSMGGLENVADRVAHNAATTVKERGPEDNLRVLNAITNLDRRIFALQPESVIRRAAEAEFCRALYETSDVAPVEHNYSIGNDTEIGSTIEMPWTGAPITVDMAGTKLTLVTTGNGEWAVDTGNYHFKTFSDSIKLGRNDNPAGPNAETSSEHLTIKATSNGITIIDHSTNGTTVSTKTYPTPAEFHTGQAAAQAEASRGVLSRIFRGRGK